MIALDRVAIAGLCIVLAAWFGFIVVMVRRSKPPADPATEAQRDRRSLVGIALQAAAYAVAWWRPTFAFEKLLLASQSRPWNPLSAVWLAIIAALMVAGVLLARTAIYTLGKQWTLVAQVGERHTLVTHGPYAKVRNPIYTAMLLLLIGTGLALNTPMRLVVALLLFTAGTAVRVHYEERLLRARHGAEFDAYRRRVPAVLPRWVFPSRPF